MSDPHRRKAPLNVPEGSIMFRLLCHSSRTGGVIGKSGSVIKRLQTLTSSRIRVEYSPPDSPFSVISVVASSSLIRTLSLASDDVLSVVSPAQEAVLRVFERVVEVAAETEDDEERDMMVVSCRLLVEGLSVGAVMGKGGCVVKKIRSDFGCRVRVLGCDNVPPSACSPGDEIVEIEGDFMAVKKALVAVSRCIQDRTPVNKQTRFDNQPFDTIPKDPLPNRHQEGEVIFKMLCSADMVGCLIGKGGTIHKALQEETGAWVVIGPYLHNCPERSIIISAMESADSTSSPAQNAVVSVYNRIAEASLEKRIDNSSARLLISPNQVGCLLGKGGSIVSGIRQATGTFIRIIGDDQVPKCASENEEVVHITGEIINVRHALYVVTGKLRDNIFSSKILNGVATKSNPSFTTGNMTHEIPKAPSPVGMRASASASQIFRHTNLTKSMDRLKLNNCSQHSVVGVNSISNGDGKQQLSSVKGGIELGSGNRKAIVMNTTVEIIVPDDIISSVYGENGSNLTQLRQISGAKVVVHEPRNGTTDRIVVISGSPDETQAAQSLLQAFILTGQS